MRARINQSGLTVNAIAGTHVVLLGLDLDDDKRPGCLGFAIQREDHTEDERTWLRSMKTFPSTDPGLGPGGSISSREHPFQTFQWSDYSAKPGYDYTYKVIPLYGDPKHLVEGDAVSVDITTEVEMGETHSVWFNRGAIASQEYARRFMNKAPDKVPGDAAYKWLSRGLLEALLAFISRANDATWEIHGAIYEFQWDAVLQGLKAAAASGAGVHIIYDGISGGSGPITKNEEAIAKAGIKALCSGRRQGKIMHNKFLVLSKNHQPVAVWTGSTNVTENGIFGHLNVGHAIENGAIAQSYFDYWQQLKKDVSIADMKIWTAAHNVAPPDPWSDDMTVIFSQHKGLKVLNWYASLAASKVSPLDSLKQKPLFMTFAFGMDQRFKEIYGQRDGVLRFALMEKAGNGPSLKKAIVEIDRIRRLPNVVVAIGNNIRVNSFDRWLAERSKLSNEVLIRYIHTKSMLVDPLGDHPVVITGSANFSQASTHTNDENMVIIRNDRRVADIYIGEFMRLWSHYAFREAVKHAIDAGKDPEEWKPSSLIESDQWQKDYFRTGSQRFLRRRYFAGS